MSSGTALRHGWCVRLTLPGLATWALLCGSAAAQRVNLQVRPNSITFPTADPDLAPVVQAQPLIIRYQVRNNDTGAWRLTVLAAGDLIAGASAIDIANVNWTASPTPPFQAGTLSRTVAQTVAAGFGNVPRPGAGTLTFQLSNLWTYAVGVYTQSIVFTLSAP